MDGDAELMAEINACADRAEENKHSHADLYALATTLAGDSNRRDVDEIEAKLKDVWRARGLFWYS